MRKEKDTQNISVSIAQFILSLIFLTVIGLAFIGCSTIREIPVNQIEKIVYKDSLIYIADTVTVEVEKQVIKEVLPQLDTSVLQTELASSIAYLDTNKRQLYHELKQEGTIRVAYDTVYVTQTVEKIIEKEIPIEVEKEVKYIPNFFWYSLIFNIIIILIFAFTIYLKRREIL